MPRLDEHYETVRDRHGYDRAADVLAGTALAPLRRRFVAVDGRETVAAALERPTIACMGVGMTGPPHLGTVGQILTGIEVQRAGLDVQFVLADLEPYHGGADWDRVRALAERYRAFALALGFDPERGRLRTQSEAREVMHTGHRLARYYRPDEWDGATDGTEPTAWERAVADHYESAGSDEDATDGPTSAAADHHSGVLHGADFLHPLFVGDYEQVLVTLGVDEHGLTPWTRRFKEAAPVEGRIAGLHTRMVRGLDAPKMAKSTGAGVSMAMAPAEIRAAIRADGGSGRPADSVVFQAMCLASDDGAARLDRLEAACREGAEEWAAAREEYAEYVAGLAEQWRKTARET